MIVERQHPFALGRMMGGGDYLGDVRAQGKTARGGVQKRFCGVGAKGVMIREDNLATVVHGQVHEPLELGAGEIHVDIDIIGPRNYRGAEQTDRHVHLGGLRVPVVWGKVQGIHFGGILHAIGGHHGTVAAVSQKVAQVFEVEQQVIQPQLHRVRANAGICPREAIVDIHLA